VSGVGRLERLLEAHRLPACRTQPDGVEQHKGHSFESREVVDP
jgi:hypothetical protein